MFFRLIRKSRPSCTSLMKPSRHRDTLNLVENRIDLAFHTGILPDLTLIARKLGSTQRVLCASPDYLACRGVPVA